MFISYGRGVLSTDKPCDKPFHINNCGIYRNINHKIYVNRPNGRTDYQIIYITNGYLEIETKFGLKKAEKGSIIVFEPKIKQYYFCGPNSNTSYCWMHFTGTKANEIVSTLNIKSGIYKIGEFDNFTTRCIEIIAAMKSENNISDIKITGLALAILGEIHEKLSPVKNNRFSDIIIMMENDTANGRKIEEYAKLCGFSHGHFIKLFKEEYGLTPANYRLRLLVDKSRAVLTDSDLKISDVALSCGFEDALYFSRVFKRFVGMSPENYRKKHR